MKRSDPVRHLTKIILLMTALLMSVVGTAAAKSTAPNELEYVKAYDTYEGGRSFFRIEIGIKGEEVESDIETDGSITKTMTIALDNTIPGKVSRHGGLANVEYAEPATELNVWQGNGDRTMIKIEFGKTIDDRSYRAHVEKANQGLKLPTRLMIDIDDYVFLDDDAIELGIHRLDPLVDGVKLRRLCGVVRLQATEAREHVLHLCADQLVTLLADRRLDGDAVLAPAEIAENAGDAARPEERCHEPRRHERAVALAGYRRRCYDEKRLHVLLHLWGARAVGALASRAASVRAVGCVWIACRIVPRGTFHRPCADAIRP